MAQGFLCLSSSCSAPQEDELDKILHDIADEHVNKRPPDPPGTPSDMLDIMHACWAR